MGRFLFCFTWIWTLAVNPILVLGQSELEDRQPKYTIAKKLLSVEDGLASHEVYCGVQDRAGFLWFGTRNGLNR